jgi:SET domain-containing protein
MEQIEEIFTVDANNKGNVARFLNHSCDPNLQNYQVWIEHQDKRLPRIAFFATRDIADGEELTFDYKYKLTGKGSIKCNCGASNCRGWLI